jgi:cytochrome c-type biogenesis protein CcmH
VNTPFWIIVIGLMILALAILVPALMTKQNVVDDEHQQRNIKIARQRLAELKQQVQEGLLTQEQFDEQYTELQLMLNDDLQAVSEVKPAGKQGKWIIPILAILLPTVSLLIYLILGDSHAQQKAELQANEVKAAENINQMVSKLEQRLAQTPDDSEGWKMLGRSFSYLQQYQKAANAYEQLYRLQPDDTETMLQYANNLAMARNGRVTGEPATLLDKVLQREPNNPNALWLIGMAKAEEGRFVEAKQYWQKLLGLLPADSESLPQVQQMLAAVDAEQDKQQSVGTPVDINVQVDIDPQLKANLPANTTVFIYAQAVNGPKMPLAIVRKQLNELPVRVILNDSVAMQGTSKLGDHQQLRILARASQSGQAMSQPGDLIGSVEIKQPFDKQVANVLINQSIK